MSQLTDIVGTPNVNERDVAIAAAIAAAQKAHIDAAFPSGLSECP